jgi:hypothetical protein
MTKVYVLQHEHVKRTARKTSTSICVTTVT